MKTNNEIKTFFIIILMSANGLYAQSLETYSNLIKCYVVAEFSIPRPANEQGTNVHTQLAMQSKLFLDSAIKLGIHFDISENTTRGTVNDRTIHYESNYVNTIRLGGSAGSNMREMYESNESQCLKMISEDALLRRPVQSSIVN